nr:recombinase RecJ [Lachnospiraceae bacterium]
LQIPIEYVETLDHAPQLLLLTDCQYGESNVTKLPMQTLAVIDHHQVSGTLPKLSEVRSNLGSACTVVWSMLMEAQYPVNRHEDLATALYYGLYTDTNAFVELSHPMDKDLQETVYHDKYLLTRLRNSNLSLEELQIAGVAMLKYEYYEKHRYAIFKADPCDPNILGLISDTCLSVDAIDACLVYSLTPQGVKFSTRSCIREVRANELAAYLAENLGGGGGHLDKAGGFLQNDLLKAAYQNYADADARHREYVLTTILRDRMSAYFESTDIIIAEKATIDPGDFAKYEKQPVEVGFVRATDLVEVGTNILVRTLEGDINLVAEDESYLMIGIRGEVYPTTKSAMEKRYKKLEMPYHPALEYEPIVVNKENGARISLLPKAQGCVTVGNVEIYARKLTRAVKVFTRWDRDNYMYGKPGDYLAARVDDLHDIYVIENTIFQETYRKR